MRVVVTGAAGFIGAELVRQLVDTYGASQLWGLDLGTEAAINWDRVEAHLGAQLVHGDVCSERVVQRLLDRARPDVVLHLAAQSHVDASLTDPTGTMYTNAVGTQVVANACAKAKVPMVYCSTDEVYGDAWEDGGELRPRTEHDVLLPSSPYSAGKAAGEMAVRAAARSMGLRYAISRGCNAYGPGQCATKLVPIACELVQRDELVPLHGGGEQIRQWIHVSEFAGALVTMAVALVEHRIENRTYNVAGPTRCTVRQLVEALSVQAGLPPETSWEAVTDRPGQDRAYAIDGFRLRDELQLEAQRDVLAMYELQLLLDCYLGRSDAAPADYDAAAGRTGGENARL